jgi:hypothetical protein
MGITLAVLPTVQHHRCQGAGVKAGVETYRDAAGTEILSLETEGPTKHTASCAGSTRFEVPPKSKCEEGFAALGGFLPASSCLHRMTGNCAY